MTGEHFGRDYWEDRYRSDPHHGSRSPSPQLVAAVAALPPGTALEVGCGEGANAIWLAQQGWRVTAVDISATALERAVEHGRAAGAEVASRLEWVEADVTATPPQRRGYGLVTSH